MNLKLICLLLSALLAASGCSSLGVKPWERELLAREDMLLDADALTSPAAVCWRVSRLRPKTASQPCPDTGYAGTRKVRIAPVNAISSSPITRMTSSTA